MFTPDMSCMVPLERFFISRLLTHSLYLGTKVMQQKQRREKTDIGRNERGFITCGSY